MCLQPVHFTTFSFSSFRFILLRIIQLHSSDVHSFSSQASAPHARVTSSVILLFSELSFRYSAVAALRLTFPCLQHLEQLHSPTQFVSFLQSPPLPFPRDLL